MNTPLNDGGPAFPRPGFTASETESQEGMSLRDWFAGQALTGLLANSSLIERKLVDGDKPITTVVAAYSIADAMLVARERK